MMGVFVTGTDTGVGKTYTTCWLVRRLLSQGCQVGAYKPLCSGAERNTADDSWEWPDIVALSSALEHRYDDGMICPQRFLAPLAPPVAARNEGREVNLELMTTGAANWSSLVDILLIEGVGGWKCPITDRETVADLAKTLGFPVLVVSPNRLGTISQTLLTVESIQGSGLTVMGILMNNIAPGPDDSTASNATEISRFTSVPVLGSLPFVPLGARPASSGESRDVEPPLELRPDHPLASIDWADLIQIANCRRDERPISY